MNKILVSGKVEGIVLKSNDPINFLGTVDKKTGVSSGTGVVGLGYLNGTDFVLIHDAIVSDTTYFINYTNNGATLSDVTTQQFGQIHSNEQGGVGAGGVGGAVGACAVEKEGCKYLKIGSNATAVDWMPPTVVSADILKSNPSQVRILMSEAVGNINSTFADFQITTTGGGMLQFQLL